MTKRIIPLFLVILFSVSFSNAQNKEWQEAMLIHIEDAKVQMRKINKKENAQEINLMKVLDTEAMQSKTWTEVLLANDGKALRDILKEAYKKMKIKSTSCNVVLLCPGMLNAELKICADILFGSLKVPKLSISMAGPLAAHSKGLDDVLVIYLGESDIILTGLKEGNIISPGPIRLGIKGGDITNFLIKQLIDRGINMGDDPQTLAITIRDEMCYVAEDVEDEFKRMVENPDNFKKSYKLPSGDEIELSKELFMSPEIIFNPALFQMETAGLEVKIIETLNAIHPQRDENSVSDIVLLGPLRYFTGLDARLKKKVSDYLKVKSEKVNVDFMDDLQAEFRKEYTIEVIGKKGISIEEYAQKGLTTFQ